MSRSKLRQMEAEAAERARIEKEGVVVLRLKMADLFAKRDSIATKMTSPTDNIRGTNTSEQYVLSSPSFIYAAFEVGVRLTSPLMPDSLLRDLNPTVLTVQQATDLPTLHLPEQIER